MQVQSSDKGCNVFSNENFWLLLFFSIFTVCRKMHINAIPEGIIHVLLAFWPDSKWKRFLFLSFGHFLIQYPSPPYTINPWSSFLLYLYSSSSWKPLPWRTSKVQLLGLSAGQDILLTGESGPFSVIPTKITPRTILCLWCMCVSSWAQWESYASKLNLAPACYQAQESWIWLTAQFSHAHFLGC